MFFGAGIFADRDLHTRLAAFVKLADFSTTPEGKTLVFPTSIAFGGPDRKTAYIGSLRQKQLATFRSPVAGAPMAHW